jgi:CRP-like cAMP-binding protein
VRVDGIATTSLPPFQLVGEASLLENLQSPDGSLHPRSRATVVAAPGTSYVTWPQSAFYELQREEDSDFAYAIQLMIARQLSDKLKEARRSQKQLSDQLNVLTESREAAEAAAPNAATAGTQAAATANSMAPSEAPAPRAPAARSESAAVEVQALLDRSVRYEQWITKLERERDGMGRELQALKSVVVYSASLAALGLLGVFDTLPVLRDVPKVAVTITQRISDLPPFL